MYTFSNKLKTFSIALIILGLIGVGYSFMDSHKSTEEVEMILAEEASHHGGGHGEEAHLQGRGRRRPHHQRERGLLRRDRVGRVPAHCQGFALPHEEDAHIHARGRRGGHRVAG